MQEIFLRNCKRALLKQFKAHEKGFREEFSELYGGFLGSALKGNDYLGQALITGIQRVAKESIFSGFR